jgi:lipopolysaccharide export system protein LptA
MPASAGAQSISSFAGGNKPLEIQAEEGIEWRRKEQLYIARGKARAVHGDVTVLAEVMSAHYAKDAEGNSAIDQVEIVGNVVIEAPNGKAFGDRGIYELAKGTFILFGNDLRLESGADRVTARDSLEYWEAERQAIARGDARATREDKEIRADLLIAFFEPGEATDFKLARIEAQGNVAIKTATEFAKGARGVYYVDREFATLSGDVKITRDGNQLNGEYAEVDLASGVSRLLASAPDGTVGTDRVHGLIQPKKKSGDEGS